MVCYDENKNEYLPVLRVLYTAFPRNCFLLAYLFVDEHIAAI